MGRKRYVGGIITASSITKNTSSASGIWELDEYTQSIGAVSWPRKPGSPTIGTASETSGSTANVTFTAPQDLGLGSITYSAISSPAGGTGSSSNSPIIVSGLTPGTTYTFTIKASTPGGSSDYSSSSNSVTPAWPVYGFQSSTTWTVPVTKTYSIHTVGGGGGSSNWNGTYYGAGGGSGYYNQGFYALTAGDVLTITIGGGGGGGGNGGTTTVLKNGSTLLSGAGGNGTVGGGGGSGGSGGGGAPTNANFIYGQGGVSGSNGENGAGSGGSGQQGVAFGSGTLTLVPPGGNASYNNTAYSYAGILGYGSGTRALSNQSGQSPGGGAGGAPWGQSRKSGASGMVVIQ